jgi:hypothetical protein
LVFQLKPALRALDEDDPTLAVTIRDAIAETYAPPPGGLRAVEAPGAVWVIGARKPD